MAMRVLVVAVAIAGCKDHEAKSPPPPPPPAPAPAPAPQGPATLASGEKLTFADFWTIAGVTRTDTPATVIEKWGKPDEHGGDGGGGELIRYMHGPALTFRPDKAIQIDFAVYGDALTFAKMHPDKKLSLIGMTCAEAASHLSFAPKVEGYTTCKHYDANGWLVDVTLMCEDKVSSLVVVWYPLGDTGGQQMPPDHCGDL